MMRAPWMLLCGLVLALAAAGPARAGPARSLMEPRSASERGFVHLGRGSWEYL